MLTQRRARTHRSRASASGWMAGKKKAEKKRAIESYKHRDKRRVNNPPVGLVTPDADTGAGSKISYACAPLV